MGRRLRQRLLWLHGENGGGLLVLLVLVLVVHDRLGLLLLLLLLLRRALVRGLHRDELGLLVDTARPRGGSGPAAVGRRIHHGGLLQRLLPTRVVNGRLGWLRWLLLVVMLLVVLRHCRWRTARRRLLLMLMRGRCAAGREGGLSM